MTIRFNIEIQGKVNVVESNWDYETEWTYNRFNQYKLSDLNMYGKKAMQDNSESGISHTEKLYFPYGGKYILYDDQVPSRRLEFDSKNAYFLSWERVSDVPVGLPLWHRINALPCYLISDTYYQRQSDVVIIKDLMMNVAFDRGDFQAFLSFRSLQDMSIDIVTTPTNSALAGAGTYTTTSSSKLWGVRYYGGGTSRNVDKPLVITTQLAAISDPVTDKKQLDILAFPDDGAPGTLTWDVLLFIIAADDIAKYLFIDNSGSNPCNIQVFKPNFRPHEEKLTVRDEKEQRKALYIDGYNASV